jgi:hypothetical protein
MKTLRLALFLVLAICLPKAGFAQTSGDPSGSYTSGRPDPDEETGDEATNPPPYDPPPYTPPPTDDDCPCGMA